MSSRPGRPKCPASIACSPADLATDAVQYRRLGKSDLQISPIVFGAMALGGKSANHDEETRVRTMQAAFDRGINAIDTAPLYEFGQSERIVGRALKGRRDRIVVMTKVGLRWDDDFGDVLFEFFDDGRRRAVRKNSRPDSIRLEVDRSLERLGIDTIDLVQVHHPDPRTPIAETMGALLELRRAGKVRHI